MQQSKEQATMARGLAWLTAGNILSRLLGVAYVIPWYIWLGNIELKPMLSLVWGIKSMPTSY